jgi:hypothetical protein
MKTLHYLIAGLRAGFYTEELTSAELGVRVQQ